MEDEEIQTRILKVRVLETLKSCAQIESVWFWIFWIIRNINRDIRDLVSYSTDVSTNKKKIETRCFKRWLLAPGADYSCTRCNLRAYDAAYYDAGWHQLPYLRKKKIWGWYPWFFNIMKTARPPFICVFSLFSCKIKNNGLWSFLKTPTELSIRLNLYNFY